jgi:hypothetical protein
MPNHATSISLAERTLSALAVLHPGLASRREARDAVEKLARPASFEGGRVGIVDKGVYDALCRVSREGLNRAGIVLAGPNGNAGDWQARERLGHAVPGDVRYILVPASEAVRDVETYDLAIALCSGVDLLLVDDGSEATAEAARHMESVLRSDDFEPMRAKLDDPDPRRVVDLRTGRA